MTNYNHVMGTKKKTTKKPKRGRPVEYNEKHHVPWARMLARQGMTGKEIAAEMGVNEATIYRWKNKYPEFCKSLKEGRESTDSQVESALLRKALGGTVKETRKVVIKDEKGGNESKHVEMVEIEREVMPDTGAAIFWLKNRQPEKWRDKREYEPQIQDEVQEDELSRSLRELAEGM